MKIAIVGGGNLGTAIAEGLILSGFCPASNITITRRQTHLLANLVEQGCQVHSDNLLAVQQSQLVILAVKPYNYAAIVAQIADALNPNQHVVCSVITGVWINQLQAAIGNPLPVVRAMPNTAIAIRQSMTCLAMDGLSPEQAGFVSKLFNQLGRTAVIDETLMDAATVLGACGTAFAMRYIRANIQGGIEIGFDANTAALIAAQTVLGAADLLLKTNSHPEREIDKVTTPKGCTIAGLNEMEHQGFSSSLIRGIVTSFKKIGN